jgi:hypothetical protein
MTAVKITIFSFSCDQPGCREVVEIMPDLPYLSYAARQLREREDWATGQGKYFCPVHKRPLRSAGLNGDPTSGHSRCDSSGRGLVSADARVEVHVVPAVGVPPRVIARGGPDASGLDAGEPSPADRAAGETATGPQVTGPARSAA